MKTKNLAQKRRNPVPVLFFYWATIVVPLYLQRQYFNVVQAKCWCVNFGAVVTLGVTLLYALWNGGEDARQEGPERRRLPLDLPELALLGLGLTAAVSSLRSDDPLYSFLGGDGAGVGALLWLNLALLALLLRRCLRYRQWMWLPMMAVNLLVFGLCVPHSMGVDVFGLHERIVPGQYYWYLSTLGHVNMLAGYLALLVPLFAVFYLYSETILEQILYLLLWGPTCVSMVLCGSDGMYVGLGVAAFFAIPCALHSALRLRRAMVLLACYGAVLVLVRSLSVFAQRRAEINGLSGALLDSSAGAAMLLGCTGAALLCWCLEERITQTLLRRASVVLEGLLCAVAAFFAVQTVQTFDDSWGTKRGLIWRYSLELYQKFPLLDKLLGIGPERLRAPYDELSQMHGGRVVAAHNELLQLLLTCGAAGALLWLVFWAWVLFSGVRRQVWQGSACAFFLPLCGYLGQSLVNSSNPTNVGLLCVMAACYRIALDDGADLRLRFGRREQEQGKAIDSV